MVDGYITLKSVTAWESDRLTDLFEFTSVGNSLDASSTKS